MRKFNAIVTALLLVCFVLHGVLGALQMIGGSSILLTPILGFVTLFCVLIHVVIGIKLTVDTLKIQKKTKARYFKENRLFWARRISGFAILFFIVSHMTAFSTRVDGGFVLRPFGADKLILQICLVLCIAIHVISNAKPMLISFGIKSLKERSFDILLVLSVLLLFKGAGFFVYFLYWRIV